MSSFSLIVLLLDGSVPASARCSRRIALAAAGGAFGAALCAPPLLRSASAASIQSALLGTDGCVGSEANGFSAAEEEYSGDGYILRLPAGYYRKRGASATSVSRQETTPPVALSV